jgi:hypothetical protein
LLVPNTPRSQLPGEFITGESRVHHSVFTRGESRLPGEFTRRELRLSGEFTRRELRLSGVFITGSRLGYRGVVLPTFRSI